MGFLSSLARIQAAVSTGGASLLAPVDTQVAIGKGVAIGGALIAGGAGVGTLLAGGTAGAAGTSALSSFGGVSTFGSQLLAKGAAALGTKLGIAGLAAPPDTTGLPGGMPDAGAGFMSAGLTPTTFDQFGTPVTGTPGGGFMPVAAGPGVGGMIGRGAAAISRMIGNLVFSASGRIRGVMSRAGQFISAKRLYSGAKVLGLEAAAAAAGITLAELAQVVFQESTRRRRRHRGISAADMKRTRSTTRKIIRMHADLAHLCSQAGMHRGAARRHTAQPVFARTALTTH